MFPLLALGYARPLEATDLYKLPPNRGAAYISDLITDSFLRRVQIAEEYNARLAKGEIGPGIKGAWWSIIGKREEKEREWREKTGKRKASLVWAMNDSVKWWFWSGGLLKVFGDTAQITSPLVVKVRWFSSLKILFIKSFLKAIIKFATDSYVGHRTEQNIPPIGLGIGLALALLIIQVIASLCSQHFSYRSTSSGVLLRGGLINAIYNRSLRLTSRARSTLTNGKLINHISTDVSRIDFCAGYFHMVRITAPGPSTLLLPWMPRHGLPQFR